MGEAFSNLVQHGISPDPATIRVYLEAKGALIRYFRGPGKSVAKIYEQKIQKPTIAGAILPDWVLALAIIVDLIAGGFTIADVLHKALRGKVGKQEAKTQGSAILNIKEVQNLRVIVNEARRSTKRRKKRNQ